ncbi:terminase small subunit [Haliea sp. E1-2-M8]|uniref:terminase small subunit n=1 Tax=Haliea sp. E1-2-M8 TaxID=3064706 RepID=UPI00271EB8BB|nr:terminase small subunit [Haliea sp. E1-2-M8]MDO8863711.1 terminase small subunit [Haliea sp. E1-2-M8]
MPNDTKKLTPRQEVFVMEYLTDLNATQAAIRAGYSPKYAGTNADKLRKNTNVAAAIAEAKAERSIRTQITADWLLQHLADQVVADLADIYHADTGTLKPIHEWPLIWRQGLVLGVDVQRIGNGDGAFGEVIKIRLADRTRLQELVGRHVDVEAWKDNHKVEVVESDLVEKLNAALKRAGVKSG